MTNKSIKVISVFLSAILLGGCSAENKPEAETTSSAAEKITTAEEAEDTIVNYRLTEIYPDKPVIALTFDDGPNTTTTLEVLEKLEKYKVVASFFLVGNNITDESAESVKKAYAMGCEIDNHSLTHSYMNTMTADYIKSEIDATSEKIFSITGEYPLFFRPPYIAVSDEMWTSIELPFICGVGANDWDNKVTAEIRATKIIAQASDGGIILLHDMAGNSKTVEALDTIIPKLLEDGYQFVTVSQLFEAKGIEPVTKMIYSNVSQTGMY